MPMYPEVIIRKVTNGYWISVEIPRKARQQRDEILNRIKQAITENANQPFMSFPVDASEVSGIAVFVASSLEDTLDIVRRELAGADVPEAFKDEAGPLETAALNLGNTNQPTIQDFKDMLEFLGSATGELENKEDEE